MLKVQSSKWLSAKHEDRFVCSEGHPGTKMEQPTYTCIYMYIYGGAGSLTSDKRLEHYTSACLVVIVTLEVATCPASRIIDPACLVVIATLR